MSKHDFELTTAALDSLKKSFDFFLKDAALSSFEKIGADNEFGKEVAMMPLYPIGWKTN
ncbi:hypothetical protein [Flavobacterium cupreum]|uniref:hypothetical protein n=1 Tax=Flavobacterium cupreum TaxID=2133766 RepID=UPI00137587FF|nr:hypothetical protein [Flavobacterium cupreum]